MARGVNIATSCVHTDLREEDADQVMKSMHETIEDNRGDLYQKVSRGERPEQLYPIDRSTEKDNQLVIVEDLGFRWAEVIGNNTVVGTFLPSVNRINHDEERLSENCYILRICLNQDEDLYRRDALAPESEEYYTSLQGIHHHIAVLVLFSQVEPLRQCSLRKVCSLWRDGVYESAQLPGWTLEDVKIMLASHTCGECGHYFI